LLQFTDGQAKCHGFKSLGLRKVDELVGYGLPGEKAPNLARKASTHLEVFAPGRPPLFSRRGYTHAALQISRIHFLNIRLI
jgi:hypothetical protein